MSKDFGRVLETGSTEQEELFNMLESIILKLYPQAVKTIDNDLTTYKFGKGKVTLAYWENGVRLGTNNPLYIAGLTRQNPSARVSEPSFNVKEEGDLSLERLEKAIRQAMKGG